MKRITALALCFAAGCAAPGPALGTPEPENQMRSDHAPTPFSANDIRGGTPAGRDVRFLLETSGQPTVVQRMHFVEPSDEAAGFEISVEDQEGNVLQAAQAASAPWPALQSHASFPTDATSISQATHTGPLGTLECWLYTVAGESDGDVVHFWFDPNRPGPPVERAEYVNGELTSRMLMISDERP